MLYSERAPRKELSAFVDAFWWSHTPAGTVGRVLPDGCVDILVEAGQAPRVVGSMTRAKTVQSNGAPMFGIRFKPGGAAILLGLSVNELVDVSTHWDGLTAPMQSTLQGGLLQTQPCIARVEHWLLTGRIEVDQRLVRAGRLAASCLTPEGSSIRQLADRSGVSRQHLRREVLYATGLTPKLLQRIGRLQRAVAQLREEDWELVRVAIRSGYCDQAHFCNEFRELVGVTPRTFAQELDTLH